MSAVTPAARQDQRLGRSAGAVAAARQPDRAADTRAASPSPRARTAPAARCRDRPAALRAARCAGSARRRRAPLWTRSGERRRRRLAERLRQVDAEADQVAGHADLRLAARRSRASRGSAAWPAAAAGARARRARRRWRSASAVAVPWPLKRSAPSPCEPPSKLDVAAEHPRARAADREAAAAVKSTAPLARRQQRRVGRHADVVAGQRDAALDAASRRPRRAARRARASARRRRSPLRRGERLAGPAADRRGVDEAQHLGERAARRALDVEARRGRRARDARPARRLQSTPPSAPGALRISSRRAIEDQLAATLRERRPGESPASAGRDAAARPARRRRSRPRPWRRCGTRRRAPTCASWNGKSQRSPRTRKVALAIVPSSTAPAT